MSRLPPTSTSRTTTRSHQVPATEGGSSHQPPQGQVQVRILNWHCEVSIDEAMIPFKGRSSRKQCLPLKPVKRGFRVWAMSDATNGYMCDFDVYTGATCGREVVLGEKVLSSDSIMGRHHQLYFDNYFTSVNLLSTLLNKGTYACGTIRTNRKQYPAEIREVKKSSRGESAFCQSVTK
ncbi:MAG: transposase [Proteobacteria bacterium]|nr:transposase [Pseudomonadota bacterium]